MSTIAWAAVVNVTAAALDCLATWRCVDVMREINPIARGWMLRMGKGPGLVAVFALIAAYSASWVFYSSLSPTPLVWLGVGLLTAQTLAHITGVIVNVTGRVPRVLRPVFWLTVRLFHHSMPKTQRKFYAYLVEDTERRRKILRYRRRSGMSNDS